MKRRYLLLIIFFFILWVGINTNTIKYTIIKLSDASVTKGDINNDGKISSFDYIMVRKYLLNVLAGNADETADIDYTLVDISSDLFFIFPNFK